MITPLRLAHRMTVADFADWLPPDDLADRRWELIDGEPVCVAPPSVAHCLIQAETARLLGNHLAATRPHCRIAITPGVIPRASAELNQRVPDLAVTCTPAPPAGARSLSDPILLIEILSPSNEVKTRANVWAYTTIPSVQEILLISSTAIRAELLRRESNSAWPPSPLLFSSDALLVLDSIASRLPLAALYATTRLA